MHTNSGGKKGYSITPEWRQVREKGTIGLYIANETYQPVWYITERRACPGFILI